jgi:hypothetical protein
MLLMPTSDEQAGRRDSGRAPRPIDSVSVSVDARSLELE